MQAAKAWRGRQSGVTSWVDFWPPVNGLEVAHKEWWALLTGSAEGDGGGGGCAAVLAKQAAAKTTWHSRHLVVRT